MIPTNERVVEIQGLFRTFPGPPPVEALLPCDVTIRRGEFVALTGPSGSGKTTLLSLLGLLDTPTGGHYQLDGKEVADLSDDQRAALRAHRIGFVFQAFHLMEHRTAAENVELGLLYHGVPAHERRLAAESALDEVGLAHRRNARCGHLSGGEKQRVAIARALVKQPSLVLCDEPTGNLDSENSEHVLRTIEALHRGGMTIVIVTHAPEIASRAGRGLALRDGFLISDSHAP